MNNIKKIAVFTGTRAEYGLMRTLIKKIDQDSNLELFLLISSTHLDPKFGKTIDEIRNDNIPLDYLLPISIKTKDGKDMANQTAEAIKLVSKELESIKPNFLIILGDRFESFGAATAAHLLGIPIIHLHGGETSLGAFDDKLRNAITQLSSYHFTSANIHKKKVENIICSTKNVHNIGPMVIDGLLNLKCISKKDFEIETGFIFARKNVLITFHSETLSLDYGINGFVNLLKELNKYQCNILFTAPNADVGSNQIMQLINDFIFQNKKTSFYKPSLGQNLYLNALKMFDFIIGNSSSGIIEAPLLKKKVLNIGNRQKGRFRFGDVTDVSSDKESISKALKKLFYSSEKKAKEDFNFKKFLKVYKEVSPSNQILNFLNKPL